MSETHPMPGYWMHETSGVLRPVIEAYLAGEELNAEQVATMRAYLRQWIEAPGWGGLEVDELRQSVRGLDSRHRIKVWLRRAELCGIDPL